MTLASLVDQTVAPDEIQLWIAREEFSALPKEVLEFGLRGVTILSCDDLKSYKKLVPALERNPEAFIVTADDDLFYEPTWLQQLVFGYDAEDRAITCRRAHRVRLDADGRVAPYLSWGWEVWDDAARQPSVDIMPTSGAGALYPPHSLDWLVTNRNLFQELSPTADDLWFYWMARRAKSKCKVVGRRSKTIGWPLPPEDTLAAINNCGGNDRQIKKLEAALGNPTLMKGAVI